MTRVIHENIDEELARCLAAAREEIAVCALSLIWPSKRVTAAWPLALRALALAPSLGKAVRILLPAPRKDAPATKGNARAAARAREYGADARLDFGPRLLHAKYVIIDRSMLWCGSANMTTAALRMNHEAAVIISSSDAVRNIYEHFERLWRDSRE